MSQTAEAVVRAAYEAYGRGEVTRLLELVHPHPEWSYLDPAMADPQPQVCHGQAELAALGQQAGQGLVSQVEEFASSGGKVMVTVRTPRADQRRPWKDGDRSYLLLTMAQGQITATHAFREHSEACRSAGLDQDDR